MARFDSDEPRGISLPDKVLDQIRSKEEKGEYGKDERFASKRKLKGAPVSRKNKRKEERLLKKQKRSNKAAPSNLSSKTTSKSHNSGTPKNEEDSTAKLSVLKKKKNTVEDPLAELAALKRKKAKGHSDGKQTSKQKSSKKKSDDVRIVRESDLDSESFEQFDDEMLYDDGSDDEKDPMAALRALKEKKADKSEVRVIRESDLEDEFDDEELSEEFSEEEDPMAALAALKAKKNANSDVRVVRESDLEDDFDSDDMEDFSGEEEEGEESDPMGALKALKMKKAASQEEAESDVSEDELLSENDFDDDDGASNEELEEEEDPLAKLKALKEAKNKKIHSKQKVVEATFVDPVDNDMEFYAKKLGLSKGKKSKLEKTSEDDVIGGLLDGLDFDYLDEKSNDDLSDQDESDDYGTGSDEEPQQKENPFVAPTTENATRDSESTSGPSRYIPPALRRKLAMENAGVSEEVLALQRAIKGPINKMSEANVGSIVNEINGLFLNNPRQLVNENLTNLILESIIQQGRLLDTFVYLHATLVVAIYRLQGVDFGAYFIQTLIEKFEQFRGDSKKSKEALNISSLLSAIYAFQLVSSKLLYDIIRTLIENLSESNSEILLKIVRNSGNQMRTDDPSALKEIVLLITKKSASMPKESVNMRMQFLIETITSLKNNKMKTNNEDSHQLVIRLKKFLGTFTSNKFSDPIQVSLQDIKEIDTKGKWWLVGSAWKGREGLNEEALVNSEVMNDILDSAEPNWLDLAKAQRMNTDIRRAIFISIMSANDFVDAVTKLDKLALKKAQERDIPRILIHCAVVEPSWNPYYGVLAGKLCDSHSLRKTFQFMLWDLIKGFEGSNDDDSEDEELFYGFEEDQEDDDKLKKILNLGRLFGHLFAEGSLALHILRTVNFVTASSDNKLFMEVLFVTFLDQVGKKSQINAIGVGLGSKKSMSEQKFDDKVLIERILKAKEQPSLLKGIQHFIGKRLRNSDFITGRKQRKRVEWGINAMSDIIDEFVKEYSL